MRARCARCQGTFTTDRFGRQTCPHCGSELLLADPNAPAEPASEPGVGARDDRPPPGEPAGAPAGAPPPAPPPPAPPEAAPPPTGSAWGAPPASGGGWGPPPGGAGGAGWGPPPPPSGGGGWAPPSGGGGGWSAPPPGGWYPGGAPHGPGGPGGGLEAPGSAAPFAEREQRGLLSSFFETWKLVAIEPQRFFRQVRVDQTRSALLFAVIAYTVGVSAQSIYGWLLGGQMAGVADRLSGYLPEGDASQLRDALAESSGAGTIAQILFAPVLALVAVYLTSAVFHGVLLLLRGAPRGFDATLTVVAYGYGLTLLLAVPGCGAPVALVWAVVAWIVGLAEAQRCGAGKAGAAVLSPVVLACVCCCGAAGLGTAGLLRGVSGSGLPTTTL